MKLTDLHHHLAFGVDDGAPDEAAAREMLRKAAAQGVGTIVCTSHTVPGLRELNLQTYRQRVARLREMCAQEQLPLTLLEGAEIFCTPETVPALRAGRVLTLAGTSCVLVEFATDFPGVLLDKAVSELTQAGYRAVIAHVERYEALRDPEAVRSLRLRYDAVIQVNASAVLGSGALIAGRRIRTLLREGLADAVASDAHHPERRPCRLGEAHAFLTRHYGSETADKLCSGTPRSLLALP